MSSVRNVTYQVGHTISFDMIVLIGRYPFSTTATTSALGVPNLASAESN